MPVIRYQLINDAINRSYALIDYKIYDNLHKRYEFKQKNHSC